MHKITGRHGNECFSSEKPAAYRPCHLQPCNEKINVNTITSPRLGKQTKSAWLSKHRNSTAPSILHITLNPESFETTLITFVFTKLDLFT
jgi:hypothetical protein